MHTISLEGMEFFAYHGLMPTEELLGNRFRVDVCLQTDFTQAALYDDLAGTINYAEVYQIIAQVMQKPTKLLEHIAYKICQNILQQWEQVQAIEVSVYKHNPPLGGLTQWAKITIKAIRPKD